VLEGVSSLLGCCMMGSGIIGLTSLELGEDNIGIKGNNSIGPPGRFDIAMGISYPLSSAMELPEGALGNTSLCIHEVLCSSLTIGKLKGYKEDNIKQ
jgi:hypothetical protein